MKSCALVLLVGLVSVSAFADEMDPRVAVILRTEQSALQSFCFTFSQDGVRNAAQVAGDCIGFSANRYFGNFHVAGATKGASGEGMGESIARAHAEFCASVGEFARPGGWVKGDCDAWNRERGELFRLGTTAGTPSGVISAKIDRVSKIHRRFCQSLMQAGTAGRPEVFANRVSLCHAGVKNAVATERAIFLGAF